MAIGEDELIRLLVQRRAMVYAYVRSILSDADLAEDVFQEVAVISLKKREQIESTEHLGAWFRKIARFESLNALRRKQRRPVLLDDGLLDLVDAAWDRQESVNQDERVEVMRRCIQGLPERSRQLMEMRYSGGLSGKELAEHGSRLSPAAATAAAAA